MTPAAVASSCIASGAEPLVVRERVRRYLADYFMTGDLPGDDVCLVEDLGADSLDLLQVVHAMNDIFEVEIDVARLPEMLTVGGACKLVDGLHHAREAAPVTARQSAM